VEDLTEALKAVHKQHQDALEATQKEHQDALKAVQKEHEKERHFLQQECENVALHCGELWNRSAETINY